MRKFGNFIKKVTQWVWLATVWLVRTVHSVIFKAINWFVFYFKIIIAAAASLSALIIIFGLYTNLIITAPKEKIYLKISDAPTSSVALVFGAGLKRGGAPSDVLADRVDVAVELYKANKVKKILMTGDNGSIYYNEVIAMKEYAISKGVPAEDITLDYAGFRSYDSCYRAKAIFGVEDVIAVSQAFHLPRIIYLCEARGIKTVGVVADKRHYLHEEIWYKREFIARAITWVEVNITKPKPKFLGPYEPIFSETK